MAVIPARGGSKGVLRKNLAPLGGRPLIDWTLRAALDCARVSETWVSTEDAEIAAVARATGAGVIDRPVDLGGDGSLSSDVLRHALAWRRDHRPTAGPPCDAFVLLQPTSPFRDAEMLDQALAAFQASGRPALVGVCEVEHHPMKMLRIGSDGGLVPLFDARDLERPRQALPRVVRQNGAIYAGRIDAFLADPLFIPPGALAWPMSPETSLDIDTPADLEAARGRV